MTSCKKTNCLIAVLAVFAFMFLYDKLFHGCPWMMEQYQKTSNLWRTPEAMHEVFAWFFVRYALLAGVITCLYKRWSKAPCCCKGMSSGACGTNANAPGSSADCGTKKCCPRKCGICFGIKVGVLMGVIQASSYIWLPIPGELAIAWFVGALVQGIGVGIILSLILSKSDNSECTSK